MSKLFSRYLLFGVVLSLVMGIHVAKAEGEAPDNVSDRARNCGVFPGALNQIQSSVALGSLKQAEGDKLLGILLTACESGLPVAPFEDKLAEGLAKKVPSFRIVATLNAMLDKYSFAKELLGDSTQRDYVERLVIIGDGLSRGASQSDFSEFVERYVAQPHDAYLTGMKMLSLLSQSNFDYALSQSILDAGFSNESLTSQWRYLIRIVLVARQRGLTDSQIAEASVVVLNDSGSVRDVSTRLGFTSRDLAGREYSN